MSRVLGIDHGTVRIGLALSDQLGVVAHPLKTLDATRPGVLEEIAAITTQKRIQTVVIGLPIRMDGARGSAAERVEKFTDRLRKVLPHEVEIHLVDERLSSVEAERSLGLEGKQKTRQQKELVDQVAAVAILQDYLNQSVGSDGWMLPEMPEEKDEGYPPRNRRR